MAREQVTSETAAAAEENKSEHCRLNGRQHDKRQRYRVECVCLP